MKGICAREKQAFEISRTWGSIWSETLRQQPLESETKKTINKIITEGVGSVKPYKKTSAQGGGKAILVLVTCVIHNYLRVMIN